MTEPKFVYVASPYRADTYEGIAENVERAAQAARDLLAKGHYPVCEHTMCSGFEIDPRFDDETFLVLGEALVTRCDWLLLLAHSPGADRELAVARERGMVVFRSVDDIPEAER